MIKKEYIQPEVTEYEIKLQSAILDLSKMDINDKENPDGTDDGDDEWENW